MRIFKIVVVIGLCASLFLNLFLLNKINEADNRINALFNSNHEIINTVNAQIGQVHSAINNIKEDQDWLSHINLEAEIDEVDKNEARVNFEWQIKELEKDSEVYFNYKSKGEKEYQTVRAINQGNGLFKVEIPVEIKAEPIWNYSIVDEISDLSREQAVEKIKREYKSENQLSFNYYVSVTNNSMTKSSEINTSYLDNLGARHYGYLEAHIVIDKSNDFSMSLSSGKMLDAVINLKDVYLEKYIDGQLIESEKLEKMKYGVPLRGGYSEFQLNSSKEKFEYGSLVLKVIYSDGSVFEKEIYNK